VGYVQKKGLGLLWAKTERTADLILAICLTFADLTVRGLV